VYLDSGECWSFSAPRYVGDRMTKLRFRLALSDEKFLYSNEYDGSINAEQFAEKQGHAAENLMDPYDD